MINRFFDWLSQVFKKSQSVTIETIFGRENSSDDTVSIDGDETSFKSNGIKYPTGMQVFSEIRQEQYLYIDKTAHILKLISSGKYYFLSRPRRFGKSFLVSTLASLFKGESHLFEGLDIAQSDYEFIEYPVIKLDFGNGSYRSAEDLYSSINYLIDKVADDYDISLTRDLYNQKFDELIVKLRRKMGQKVVVLIDEYDKPIINNISNKPVLEEMRQVMNNFYSVLKAADENLRFVFITGVSKFSKVTVFSGMNNPKDLTMDKEYASICGVTDEELVHNFKHALTQLANKEEVSQEDLLVKIRDWYNGYAFHPEGIKVYNPFSLLNLFDSNEFKNYWYTSATPTFLIDLMKEKDVSLAELTGDPIIESSLEATEPELISPQPLMLQTGYLTIADFKDGLYQLDFPNREVKLSFIESIVQQYSYQHNNIGDIHSLKQAISTGNVDLFIESLRHFFSKVPYDIAIKQEKYYQSLLFAILQLLGYQVEAEVRTNIGRIDCVLQTIDTIYIMEFKLDGTKEEALKQIHDNQYPQKYCKDGKEIILLGVSFDHDKRNIGEYIQEKLC